MAASGGPEGGEEMERGGNRGWRSPVAPALFYVFPTVIRDSGPAAARLVAWKRRVHTTHYTHYTHFTPITSFTHSPS